MYTVVDMDRREDEAMIDSVSVFRSGSGVVESGTSVVKSVRDSSFLLMLVLSGINQNNFKGVGYSLNQLVDFKLN